jgi:hypothetical protein
MQNSYILPVSVVIATLGNKSLINTIESLNSTKYKPKQILVCIPLELKTNVDLQNKFDNVIIHYTSKFGQVYQRSEGFKIATEKYVLQLDDDIIFTGLNLKDLLSDLNELDDKSAIGPQYFNLTKNIFCYTNFYGLKKIESYLIEYFLGGSKFGKKRMGTISKSGQNFNYDINYMKQDMVQVEWLAGGCVLHLKKNLITYDFYPFSGKAYCEDLIHSFLLTENSIKLFLTKNVICNLEDTYEPIGKLEILKEKTARNYLLILINGSYSKWILRRIYWSLKFKLRYK